MFISVRKRQRFKRTMLRPAGARKTRGLFWIKVKMLVTWCPILCNPMDCGPPGSSVHGIFQAGILEWLDVSSSRGSFHPRDWIHISCIPCFGRQILYQWATWEALSTYILQNGLWGPLTSLIVCIPHSLIISTTTGTLSASVFTYLRNTARLVLKCCSINKHF